MRDQLGYVAEWDLDVILVFDAQRATHQRLSWVAAAVKQEGSLSGDFYVTGG